MSNSIEHIVYHPLLTTCFIFFFSKKEAGTRDLTVTGVQTCALPISRLQQPPHTPEITLHLADEITPIWKMTEEALAEIGLPPPFWAFAWAGGQALARYIL